MNTPNGLLIINKPDGMTSHDVVNRVRRIAQTRRVGHTGTLDPMAMGVLVVLVGHATRLAQYVSGCDKTYRATLRLGITTETYDAEGAVTGEASVNVSTAELDAALTHFRGPIQQVPPMYSAIKVQGKKLYELARQGKEITREPRDVTIHTLTVVTWDAPTLILDVTCSTGTYIRSLAHDLGQTLGCGAHLTALTRTAVGTFTLSQAHTLEKLAQPDEFQSALQPPRAAIPNIPAITLTTSQAQAVQHGQTQLLDIAGHPPLVQAWDVDSNLLALLIPVGEQGWRPKLVFPINS